MITRSALCGIKVEAVCLAQASTLIQQVRDTADSDEGRGAAAFSDGLIDITDRIINTAVAASADDGGAGRGIEDRSIPNAPGSSGHLTNRCSLLAERRDSDGSLGSDREVWSGGSGQ